MQHVESKTLLALIQQAEAVIPGYRQDVSVDALDEAIAFWEQILQHPEFANADTHLRLMAFNNRGIVYIYRYQERQQIADLNMALLSWQQALQLTTPHSPELPLCLNNLGIGLSDRYERLGEVKDLQDSIAAFQQTVRLFSPHSPELPRNFHNLGSGLLTRYVRGLGEVADLEEGIAAIQKAVQLSPPNSPDLPIFLDKLGTGLRERYKLLHQLQDLKNGIAAHEKAVELTKEHSPNSPNLPKYISNLRNGHRELNMFSYDDKDLKNEIEANLRNGYQELDKLSHDDKDWENQIKGLIPYYSTGSFLAILDRVLSPSPRDRDACLDEVTFEFNKLGFVDSGRIKLADLTMLCGPNNVGKTYLSYAIYGLLKHISKLSSITLPKSTLAELKKTGVCSIQLSTYAAKLPETLQQASAQFSKKLSNFFNVSADLFKGSSVSFHIEAVTTDFSQPFKHTVQFGTQAGPQDLLRLAKEAGETVMSVVLQSSELPASILQDIIAEQIAGILLFNRLPRPFVITSERTGIALFYKELDISKNAILEQLTERDKVNPFELLNQLRSRYAEPIKDNIDLVRDYDTLSQRQSFIREEPIKYQAISKVLKQLVGGCFTTVNKQVMYQPAKEEKREVAQLPVYIASSSVKSLFLFDYYLNCLALPGDILIIDEPELNLHPDKQRLLASLLARLVNAGIKVLCTTHSDFLVKEINNRIMLSRLDSQKRTQLFKRGLVEEDILQPKQVSAYTVDYNHQIQEIERTKGGWLDMEIFDNLIADSNELADEIYDNLGE